MLKIFTFCCFFLVFVSDTRCEESVCVFSAGDYFPEIVFQAWLTQQERDYFEIPDTIKKPAELDKLYTFTFFDIKAEIVIIEFLNIHCPSCQAQAPVMNRVYELIQKDTILKEKVKIIGICPGNNLRETNIFKKENSVAFPLIPDPKFYTFEALGDPCGTPFVLIVSKKENNLIITFSHMGLISTPFYLVQEAWDTLNADIQTIVAQARQKRSIKVVMEDPVPFISREEIESRIHASMESKRLELTHLEKISLSDGRNIFVGSVRKPDGNKIFYSKLISRNPVCDVCHAIHFILIFDDQGIVIDFIPVHITKYGNVKWDYKETKKIREKLIGTSVLKPVNFDPRVDAVSLATMSSALIFNSVERVGKDFLQIQKLPKKFLPSQKLKPD